jgi:hypothetical protein
LLCIAVVYHPARYGEAMSADDIAWLIAGVGACVALFWVMVD